MEVVCVSALRKRRHEGTNNTNYLVAAGEAAGFTDTGELLVPAGVEVDGGVAVEAGGVAVDAGWDPAEPAGRKPRLLGLFSMFAARLLTIFASLIAVSSNAAFRICLR